MYELKGTGSLYIINGDEEYSPNRIDTADIFERGNAQAYLDITDVVSVGANTPYTYTVFVKQRDENDNTRLVLRVGRSLNEHYAEAHYHLKNAIATDITGSGDAIDVSSSIISIGDGWFACSLGFQYTRGGNISVFLSLKDGDTGLTGTLGAERTNYSTSFQVDSLFEDGSALLGSATEDPFESVSLENMIVLDSGGEQIPLGYDITKTTGEQPDSIKFSEPYPELPITVVDATTGSEAADTEVVRSAYIWNPQLEQRQLNEDPSYLGSGHQNRVLALENVMDRSYPEDSRNKGYIFVPIFAPETDYVTYNNSNGVEVRVDVLQEASFTTRNSVRYIRIPQQRSDGFPDSYTIQYNRALDGVRSRTFNIDRDEVYAKRTPILCTFVNKDGALEGFWLTRKSVEALQVKNETYYKNNIDYGSFGYNTTAHSMQVHNPVGVKQIRASTGNLPEYFNSYLEELQMSEKVWLTYEGTTYPVLLKTLSLAYKTHVNDKLVRYDLVFEHANRVSNTII